MNDILFEACVLSQNNFVDSFLPAQEHVFGSLHNKKMEAIFSKIRNRKYHRITIKALKALIIAAIILSFAITAFAIEAMRSYYTFNIDVGTLYSAVNGDTESIDNALNVGYIPDGYTLVKEQNESQAILKKFISENNNLIIIEKYVLNSDSIFDTDKFSYEEIYNNGIKYLYYPYGSYNCLIWNNGKFIYIINSVLSKDEALHIAFSTN